MVLKKTVHKFSLLITLVLMVSCTGGQTEDALVRITGKLVNWGNASKILRAESIQADFGLGQDFILSTNENDMFEVSFHLEEATYYSLGRNKLFLQPGDELYMEVDYRDPEAGIFEGTNQSIQEYLGGVAFPKSGSYLSGGREVKSPEMDLILELAERKTNERRALLEALPNVSAEFLMLENMRLKLDHLNTILSFPIYGSFKEYWEYSEDKKAEVLSMAKNELNDLSTSLLQDKYMKHPNFRDMLLSLVDAQLQEVGIFDQLQLTTFMEEYDAMGALVSTLELSGLTEEMQRIADDYINGDHPETYQQMAAEKLGAYSALNRGESAFDVTFKDLDDNPVNLSAYKGKLIYVDLWATWCGPCIEELPAFEALKAEYANQDIAFVPVSIDTNLEAWRKYLAKKNLTDSEYIINRLDLSDYKVITIPRYFLIDKDFRIISVFATKPSDPETRRLIEEYL